MKRKSRASAPGEVVVWAPHARRVAVILWPEAERLPCVQHGDGFHCLRDRRLEPGRKYSLELDGGPARPDPRSAAQPEGVHGPSRLVDFSDFRWTDAEFIPAPRGTEVIYEVHVGTFTEEGTFDAIIEHLPQLVELGVTHLELMPVAQFAGSRGWGYDGVDLFAPHDAYGGPEGLFRLVDACHAQGLGMILDVVYNHLGPSGNYLAEFGPYFSARYHTPWGDTLNFDGPGSDEVRRFVCDNALFWLENYHIDGLRLDAVHYLFDQSPEHILAQVTREVGELSDRTGRPYLLIAESDLNDSRVFEARAARGFGFDAQWSDDHCRALLALLTGERAGFFQDFGAINDLRLALLQGFTLTGRYSSYRGRRHGAPARGLEPRHLVIFTQNHDQVGNRPQGERLATLLTPHELKLAFAFTLLSPFTPMLFMGEEWGSKTPFLFFTDHHPDLNRAVQEGRRREFVEFGWSQVDSPPPGEPSTFARSHLEWQERESPFGCEILALVRDLLALRRQLKAELESPAPEVQVNEQDEWLELRWGSLWVLGNFADEARPLAGARFEVVLLGESLIRRGDGVLLAGRSAVVLRRPQDAA